MTLGQRLVLMQRFSDPSEATGRVHACVSSCLPDNSDSESFQHLSSAYTEQNSSDMHTPQQSSATSFIACVSISVNGAAQAYCDSQTSSLLPEHSRPHETVSQRCSQTLVMIMLSELGRTIYLFHFFYNKIPGY